MKNQKGFAQLILILLAVSVITLGLVYYYNKSKNSVQTPTNPAVAPQYQQSYSDGSQNVPTVNNPTDLNTVSTQLDTTDTTEIDTQLKSLDSVSNF